MQRRSLTESDRHVDSGDHQIFDGRGYGPAEVSAHPERRDAVKVTDGAVDDEPDLCRFPDIVSQIVADDATGVEVAESVNNKHVAFLQHIDRTLVRKAAEAFLFSLRLVHFRHTGAKGHELKGHRPPDHSLARTEDAQAFPIPIRKSAPPNPVDLPPHHLFPLLEPG